ncbi:hypothetical protein MHYP_G00109920 [Metynnis hypsauchen]
MRLRNGTFLTVLVFGLCGLFSLSWYTAFSNPKVKLLLDLRRSAFRRHQLNPSALMRSPVLHCVLSLLHKENSPLIWLREEVSDGGLSKHVQFHTQV